MTQNQHLHYDITIIGGGLSGVSLALLLSQSLPEFSIAIIESFPIFNNPDSAQAPSYDDRASALSLGSCRIFKSLNIFSHLAPYLCPIKQVHVSDRGHPGGTMMDAGQLEEKEEVLGYVIENRNLGQILLKTALQKNNITPFSPVTVTHVQTKSGHVQLVIEQESGQSKITTQLAVVADGANSTLREDLGISVQSTPYDQCAVIANVSPSTSHNNVAYERFTDEGPMALLPLNDFQGQHRCALVWTIPVAKQREINSMTDADFLATIQRRFGKRLGFFQHVGKRTIYPLNLDKAKEQVRQHIVLMGNAAHAMHPVAGQGFNLALRDCSALSNTLSEAVQTGKSVGDLTVLNQYLEIQHWDQEKTITTSHLLTLLFSTAKTLPAFARNTGLFGLNFLPGLKNWFAEQAMGIRGNKSTVVKPSLKTDHKGGSS